MTGYAAVARRRILRDAIQRAVEHRLRIWFGANDPGFRSLTSEIRDSILALPEIQRLISAPDPLDTTTWQGSTWGTAARRVDIHLKYADGTCARDCRGCAAQAATE
jgi:hypothetical protein